MAIGEEVMSKEGALLLAFTKIVSDEVFNELPLQQLRMFLMVVEEEGIGVPAGTVSRNLAKLGSKVVEDRDGQMKDVGYGLLNVYPDPTDPKKNTVHLTEKGKQLSKLLKGAVSNGSSH
jgi:arginine repressor